MRVLAAALVLCACSGGGGGGSSAPPPATPEVSVGTVWGLSPFPATCGGAGGTAHINAEVEPHIAVNPRDPSHLVGVWQQDRWSNGSARGLLTGVSFDGGATWTATQAPFSHCSGGNAANGGDFLRATDPWVAFAPDGTVYQAALSTTGGTFAPGSRNAVLVSRSTDGGRTWSNPAALIDDTTPFFNDKETITADPTDARFVYVVWDRLRQGGNGPTYFARTTDAGATWEAARAIYEPGADAQTIGNLIRVLPNGTLVNLQAWLRGEEENVTEARLEVIRSTDKGATWSAPIRISGFRPLGTRDPVTDRAIRDGSIVPQIAVAPGGTLYVVWQDSRFTGARDAIALSRSTDGGLTWSEPTRVNSDAGVAAFTPQVHVRADGVIGVTYFVLRPDTAAATLPADYWLARSSDGMNWTETRVSDAFDLNLAPLAGGALFLGDYMGLESSGTTFLPFFTRTTGAADNRTDVIIARVTNAAAQREAAPDPKSARLKPELAFDADFNRRVFAHLAAQRARRAMR